MVILFVGRAGITAVMNRETNITEDRDLLLFSTTGGHTTLSMVQLNENEDPPDVTQYDGCYSASEMDPKLRDALIFLLDAFGFDVSHHTKIKADVPSQIGENNCGPLACIPFIQQLTGERLDQKRWNLWADILRIWLSLKVVKGKMPEGFLEMELHQALEGQEPETTKSVRHNLQYFEVTP